MLFTDSGLKAGLLKGLLEIGYTEATTIQEKVLPLALAGKNIIGQSQTGTGKTAAFLLPLLNKIDTNSKEIQALILAPTRELIIQTNEEIYKLTKYYRVPTACIYGGVSQVNQETELKRSPRIIIATPGRLIDLISQGVIDISKVSMFVLDEVDRMLDMGFMPNIKKILSTLPNLKQFFSFSATLNENIINTIKEYVTDYEMIKTAEETTVDQLNQSYISVETKDKFINLLRLVKDNKNEKIVIFTNTKELTTTIFDILDREGFYVGFLNGDVRQSKRINTLESFTKGDIKVLVTTDLAGRGLNMDSVGLVINFDIPQEPENYIHRVGRTARAGAYGKAISLVSTKEQHRLAQIESAYNIKIPQDNFKTLKDSTGMYDRIESNKELKSPQKDKFPREEKRFGGDRKPGRDKKSSGNNRSFGSSKSNSKKPFGRPSKNSTLKRGRK